MNITSHTNSSKKPCYMGVVTVFECGGSYAGSCDHTTGSCVCIHGWSGRSDFLTMDLEPYGGRVLDCPVHVLALRVMHGIMFAVSSLYALFMAVVVVPQTWMLYRRKAHKKPGLIRWWAFGPLQVQFWVLMAVIFTAAVGCLKMLDSTFSTTLLGIHEPISSITFARFLSSAMVGHVDLMLKRNTLLKKKMFLQGESNESISQRLNNSRWRLRLLTFLLIIPAACFYSMLPAFPQSPDDSKLPFASGRFLLYPGFGIVAVILFLIYIRTLHQDLEMIDALFRRLVGMVSASQDRVTKRPSFMHKVFRKSFASKMPNEDSRQAVGSIQEARTKLYEHYGKMRKSLMTNVVNYVLTIAVPPLWTRTCWTTPVVLLMFVAAARKVSKTHTPQAYSVRKLRAKLNSARLSAVVAASPTGVPSTLADTEEADNDA